MKMSRHKCANCGHRFEGRYCPACGQHFADGRITWESVRRDIMKIWGMDSSSLPHTVWQLIRRPGQHIDAYLSGHRQESFPPTKMIFLVALVYAIAQQLLGIEDPQLSKQLEKNPDTLTQFLTWLEANPGWNTLSTTMLFLFPTWILFRFSPRHTKHTLPESIFIQLLMSTLLVICSFLEKISSFFYLLVPFYYFITYRQLFGYRFWGTAWRLLFCALVWISVFSVLVISVLYIGGQASDAAREDPRVLLIIIVFILLFFVALPLAVGYWIGKFTYKRRQRTDSQNQ